MDGVVHFEMPADNGKRVSDFYSFVFGWKMNQLGEDMGNYILATTSPVDEKNMHINKGAINGGFFPKGQYGSIPHIVIAVNNLKDKIETIKSNGGLIDGEIMEIPGIGQFIMIKDTEGNRVGMLQPLEMTGNKSIEIKTVVNSKVEKVWEYWTKPEHITKWNYASEDWECPRAENDLKKGGKFKIRMESKVGKEGFEFEGVYTHVDKHKIIEYKIADGRNVSITFEPIGKGVEITEVFEMEKQNPEEMQRNGWQAILNNFKKYVEEN